MLDTDIRFIFDKVFKGRNMMTPLLVRYGTSGVYIYELSKSDSMYKQAFGSELFGVTVLYKEGSRTTLSRSFSSLDAAEVYISELRDEV